MRKSQTDKNSGGSPTATWSDRRGWVWVCWARSEGKIHSITNAFIHVISLDRGTDSRLSDHYERNIDAIITDTPPIPICNTQQQAKFPIPSQRVEEKLENLQPKKHNYVSLIVSPANIVMFNCQGAMYYAKDLGNFLIFSAWKISE